MASRNFSVDDDTEPSHDQLPTVEDVKNFIAERSGAPVRQVSLEEHKKFDNDEMSLLPGDSWVDMDLPARSTKRVCRVVGGLGILCLGMIITIVLCVVLLEPLEKPLPNKVTYAPTLPPTQTTRLSEVKAFLATNLNTSNETRYVNNNMTGSAQQRATVWIADYDPRRVSMQPSDATSFIQRYALAVFYYSVGGEETFPADIGFLSTENECNWNKQEFYEPKNATRTIGTTCNEQMEIDGLFLPHTFLQGDLPSELDLLVNLKSVQVYY